MTALGRRDWVPAASEDYVLGIAAGVAGQPLDAIEARLSALTTENRNIHERDCFNLNPATNVMNPRAEAALGEDFDIRHFHEQVLDSGNIPLTVLEAKIDDWIAAGGK